MADKKHHPFKHLHVEFHDDGTHTHHFVHEKNAHAHNHHAPEKEGDVKGGTGSHDDLMDKVMEHTSSPNPGEDKDESNQPMAAAAPPSAAAAAPPAAAAGA